MPFKGKRTGRVLMFVAAGLLSVGVGVGVGRLSAWGQLVKAGPAGTHAIQAAGGNSAVGAQGVKVHGWWTIKVLDRGHLVAERQFENSLVAGGGDSLLADLLTHQYTMGPWFVDAFQTDGQIFELTNAADVADRRQLTVNGATPGHVILSGTYTPATANSIGRVATGAYGCPPDIASSSCVNSWLSTRFNFTSTTITTGTPPVPAPIAVAAGQIVQVTVDISFS